MKKIIKIILLLTICLCFLSCKVEEPAFCFTEGIVFGSLNDSGYCDLSFQLTGGKKDLKTLKWTVTEDPSQAIVLSIPQKGIINMRFYQKGSFVIKANTYDNKEQSCTAFID